MDQNQKFKDLIDIKDKIKEAADLQTTNPKINRILSELTGTVKSNDLWFGKKIKDLMESEKRLQDDYERLNHLPIKTKIENYMAVVDEINSINKIIVSELVEAIVRLSKEFEDLDLQLPQNEDMMIQRIGYNEKIKKNLVPKEEMKKIIKPQNKEEEELFEKVYPEVVSTLVEEEEEDDELNDIKKEYAM